MYPNLFLGLLRKDKDFLLRMLRVSLLHFSLGGDRRLYEEAVLMVEKLLEWECNG